MIENVDPVSIGIGIGIGFLLAYLLLSSKSTTPPCNPSVEKDKAKVATMCKLKDIEDLVKGEKGKVAFCRCWRSQKFPYCDGSHIKYNESCGDNTGPVVILK